MSKNIQFAGAQYSADSQVLMLLSSHSRERKGDTYHDRGPGSSKRSDVGFSCDTPITVTQA